MHPAKRTCAPCTKRSLTVALAVAVAGGVACSPSDAGGPVDAASTDPFGGADPWSACASPQSYGPGDDGGCGPGATTFQLTGAPGVEWWVNENEGTNSPSTTWLTIFSCDSRQQLDLTPTEATTSRDCSTCPASWSLPLGTFSGKLPATGQAASWDGTYYVPATCGDPAMACVTARCASAGRYVAQMCACAAADETPLGCAKPVCASVGFDYPPQKLVVGELSATDM